MCYIVEWGRARAFVEARSPRRRRMLLGAVLRSWLGGCSHGEQQSQRNWSLGSCSASVALKAHDVKLASGDVRATSTGCSRSAAGDDSFCRYISSAASFRSVAPRCSKVQPSELSSVVKTLGTKAAQAQTPVNAAHRLDKSRNTSLCIDNSRWPRPEARAPAPPASAARCWSWACSARSKSRRRRRHRNGRRGHHDDRCGPSMT